MSVSLGRHYTYRIYCTYNSWVYRDRLLCEQPLTIIAMKTSRQEIPLCPGGFIFKNESGKELQTSNMTTCHQPCAKELFVFLFFFLQKTCYPHTNQIQPALATVSICYQHPDHDRNKTKKKRTHQSERSCGDPRFWPSKKAFQTRRPHQISVCRWLLMVLQRSINIAKHQGQWIVRCECFILILSVCSGCEWLDVSEMRFG